MSIIQERPGRPSFEAVASRPSFEDKMKPTRALGFRWPLLLAVLALWTSLAAQAQPVEGQRGAVSGRAVINMQGMSLLERQHNLAWTNRPVRALGAPMPRAYLIAQTQNVQAAQSLAPQAISGSPSSPKSAGPKAAASPSPAAPLAALSPSPATSFQAQDDDNRFIPPDVGGAVGPNHVMSVHNNNVRVQDRTGNILSTVTLDSFWLAVTGPGVFDPHVVYDPFNDRWIFSAASGSFTDQSSVLLGVSQSSDPLGNWNLYRVDADPGNLAWADYDTVGFNKDWIVVTVNMFAIGLLDQFIHPYFGANMYVFSKTNLYAKGDGAFTLFQDTSLKGFTMVPAVTYDNELSTMYLVQVDDLIGALLTPLFTGGLPTAVSRLQISAITGPVGSEVLDLAHAFTPLTNAWLPSDIFFNFTGSGPQLGNFFGIDVDDTRIQNVVYRNGSLWTTHTIFEPVDLFTSTVPYHSAVQWWQLSPEGDVQQHGRLEDPAGAAFYGYPSIAVNRCSDVMLGYNKFSPFQYASAYYSFRLGTDVTNTLQSEVLLKAGEGPYFKTFGTFDNRWGDYSSTVVDPVNDIDMWTLQEYAARPATNVFGTNFFTDTGRWATWWGRIDVVGANANQISFSASAYTVNEATPGFVTVTVGNTGGNPGSVDYSTSDGTALAGTDYEPAQGTLVFGAGQTSTNFSFRIYDNAVPNPNKTINLTLSNPLGGAILGCLSNAVVTIIDDETLNQPNIAGEFVFSTYLNYGIPYIVTENETIPSPFCGFTTASVVLPNRNALGAIITVVRTNGSTGKVLVDFSTEPSGSAIPSQDYYPTNGTLVFDDYQMSANFIVPVASSSLSFFSSFSGIIPPVWVRVVLSNPRPAPEEEAQNPGLLHPKLGNGSESGLVILPINFGFLASPTATMLSSWFNIERVNYRTDEYSTAGTNGGLKTLDIDITLFPNGGPGNIGVEVSSLGGNYVYNVAPYPLSNRNPDPSVKVTLNAGSDQAEAFELQNPAVPFSQNQVWPNSIFTDPALTTITNYSDYLPTRVNASFGQGQCRTTVTVVITNDNTVEFNEDFLISLIPPASPNFVGLNPFTTVTILYDDPPAGALDREWNPDNASHTFPAFNTLPGADGVVSAVAVQDDGKTVLGGDFGHINSQFYSHIGRMNVDGSVDTTFRAGSGADAFVSSIVIYPASSTNAGKILIAGGFTSYNGVPRNGIARLLPDGSLDPTFNPGNGANGSVRAMVLQADGGIVVAGDFTFFNDMARSGFARLNPDGSVDLLFDAGDGVDGIVFALALQPDGFGGEKILVAGDFLNLTGFFRGGIARLNGDGSADLTFDPGAGADGVVYTVAVQPDRGVLIAGDFTKLDAFPRARMARLSPDGALDLSFDPGTGPNGAVFSLTLQPDGKSLIGGPFTSYNDTRRIGLARLRGDGSLDTTFLDTAYNQFAGLVNDFSFQPPNFVNSIALQADGGVIIGGSFTTVGGNASTNAPTPNSHTVFTRADKRTRNNIARLLGGATPGPGNAIFDTSNYFVDENAGTAFIKVDRIDGRLGTLSAVFSPSNHLATAGLDYRSNNVPAVWPEAFYMTNLFSGFPTNFAPESVGLISPQYIQLPILNDHQQAGDKTVDLRFTKPGGSLTLGGEMIPLGGAYGGRSFATLTIADSDVNHGIFNFSALQYATNENAGQAIITVTRTNGSVGQVSVDYLTRDSSTSPIATAGVDYTPVRGKLTFLSGQTTRSFTVPIIDDTAVEFDENIGLVLTNATGGAKLPGGAPNSIATATLTIVDNDFPPGRINFSAPVYDTNSESDGFATITVTRSGGSVGLVSVQFQTSDGTAITPSDYASTSGVLSWNDGNSVPKTFRVPLVQDGIVEGPETVNLRLLAPRVGGVSNPGLLGARTNATLIIQDSDSYGAISFSQPFYQADENAGFITITIVRRGGIAGVGSVNFAATPNTAVPGLDFVATNGVVTFQPGEISKSIDLVIPDDTIADGNKTVDLSLSNPSNVSLGVPNRVTLTIIDNESFNEPAGTADVTFRDPLVDGPVYSISLQKTNSLTDGRLVIAGDFTTINHVVRNRLARLLGNGLLDPTFDPGSAANGSIRTTAVQSDGRLMIGGFFTQVANTNRNFIARLAVDGSLDASFNPGSGADNPVFALLLQPDDKILVGGAFSKFNSATHPGIVRLNTNGSVDLSFNAGSGANDVVYAIALQSDGKILIGGEFTQINGLPFNHLARLNPNGSVDPAFNNLGAGMDAGVKTILVQPDGKFVVGGSFTAVNGVSQNYLARLNQDGSLDTQFMQGLAGADNIVYSVAAQVDGKLIVAGDFAHFNGVTRGRLTRLLPDGTTDGTINFGAGADAFVSALVIQPDRKLVIGGGFTKYDEQTHNHIARIYGGSIAGQGSLSFTRGEFEVSESGTNAIINVRRLGGTTGLVGVDFATSDGTALNGQDYVAASGTLSFPTGETIQSFVVPIIDNSVTNDDRFLNLTLSGFTGGAAIGPQPIATLLIRNDESAIGFTSEAFSVNENDGSRNATITFRRSFATNNTVSASFSTILGGTAAPYLKYIPTNSTVIFRPGEVLKIATVRIINETNSEGNQTVFLVLSNAVSNPNTATFIDSPTATLTIVDDDFGPGAISFSAPAYSVLENASNAAITLLRNGGSLGIVSVRFATGGGTAIPGLDYTPRSGIITFAQGQTNQTILIPILDDHLVEGADSFRVTISNPTGGAVITGPSSVSVLIIDNEVGPGSLDSAFDPGAGPDNLVHSVATQPDGKIIIGGAFTNVNGLTRSFVARLATNGTVDLTFNPLAGPNGFVSSVGVNESGKVIVGGVFSSVNGLNRNHVAQFLPNGGLDPFFNQPNALNAAVFSVLPRSNEKVIVGGGFSLPIPGVTRLRADGSSDVTFFAGAGLNGAVHSLAAHANGKLIVGGEFTTVDEVSRSHVVLLQADGTLDDSFMPPDLNGTVFAVEVQLDGKVLIGGSFTNIGGLHRTNIARLNTDGSLDTNFAAKIGANASVYGLALQTDGKILLGGDFTRVNGTNRNHIARLNADGSLDTSFDPGTGANGTVYSIALACDGKIMIGGGFTLVSGAPRRGIARLNGDKPALRTRTWMGYQGGQFSLFSSSQAGCRYALEASTTLGNGAWIPLRTNMALGSSISFTDTNAPPFGQRFYRVRQVVP